MKNFLESSVNNRRSILISSEANDTLIKYLRSKGYKIVILKPLMNVSRLVTSHPDVICCKLGEHDDSPIFTGERKKLSAKYPGDSIYNAVCTGKYFIHKLSITDSRLKSATMNLYNSDFRCNTGKEPQERELQFINVRQGYSKCSTVVVDRDSIITFDKGIAKPCIKAGMNVLLIEPGHIKLPGTNTGFIGGTSGKIGGEIIFNGDLSVHPSFKKIKIFIESRGLKCQWFENYPLQDIGSIIPFNPDNRIFIDDFKVFGKEM